MPGTVLGSFSQVSCLYLRSGPGMTQSPVFCLQCFSQGHLCLSGKHQAPCREQGFLGAKSTAEAEGYLKEAGLPNGGVCSQGWQDEGPQEWGTQDHSGLNWGPTCPA